ncbi:MAG: GlsB/YeaQ/YmgE family stress response membrane protein [Myxococcales bacterium]|nr:MAG: GlsB/YeaQ/YmgE family stress response membrane protein [Myxococcales bacterium]
MLAYIVVGLIMGAVAWQLKHDTGDPKPSTQMLVGVVGAVLGGVSVNLVRSLEIMAMDPWGFAAAALVALIVLGLLQAKVG